MDLTNQQFDEPSLEGLEQSIPDSPQSEPEIESEIQRALWSNETRLMAIEGVEGMGIQEDASGKEFIVVYVRDESTKARLPKVLDGFPVKAQVTGEFFAQ
jgi:hypothetical protein